ncbi:1370_t:CDS:2, partial [Ambispora leptoticha]
DIQRANRWYRKGRNIKKINTDASHEGLDYDELKKVINDEKFKLSWIPFNEFNKVYEIGQGGFATVYFAEWIDKNENRRKQVALKLIHNSYKYNQEFVDELKNYSEIGYENPSFLKCYGVSREPNSKDYIIVLEYAKEGSLRENLSKVVKMDWKKKLNLLYCVASDLESIHSQELIHRDLHSGNILQDLLHNAYISDLGLSTSSDIKQDGKIHGVMPYVAPEVLRGQQFTQAADVYSFGVIMTEISSGKRAFDGIPFNIELDSKICDENERSELGEGIPGCYVNLAKRCMDSDQIND